MFIWKVFWNVGGFGLDVRSWGFWKWMFLCRFLLFDDYGGGILIVLG